MYMYIIVFTILSHDKYFTMAKNCARSTFKYLLYDRIVKNRKLKKITMFLTRPATTGGICRAKQISVRYKSIFNGLVGQMIEMPLQ